MRRVAPLIAVVVAVVIAGLVIVFAGSKPAQESAQTNLMGEPAPDAVGTLLDGSRFDLSRRKGDWVVLNFMQSSCVPCQQEQPELEKFVAAQDARSGGARFYSVVYDDTRANVQAFFAKHGGDWPVVMDDKGSIATAFGVSQVPETWIIDPQGYVRYRVISEVTAESLGSTLERLREAT
jgi:cytochrome c biogenesis protein CcmG/thiol:disulfide interchange protein DsbE